MSWLLNTYMITDTGTVHLDDAVVALKHAQTGNLGGGKQQTGRQLAS